MEDVNLFAVEEAPPSIPQEKSLTLMIKGVLGDLIPEVRKVEEEEGSCSMPGKDDTEGGDIDDEDLTEGGNVDDEDQTEHSPKDHIEQQVIIQAEEQILIQIEESIPEKEHKEETLSTMEEDKVQIIFPIAPVRQAPSLSRIV